jgi:hypothetical protein
VEYLIQPSIAYNGLRLGDVRAQASILDVATSKSEVAKPLLYAVLLSVSGFHNQGNQISHLRINVHNNLPPSGNDPQLW